MLILGCEATKPLSSTCYQILRRGECLSSYRTDRNEVAVAGRIDKLSRRKPPVSQPGSPEPATPTEPSDSMTRQRRDRVGYNWATMRGRKLHQKLEFG